VKTQNLKLDEYESQLKNVKNQNISRFELKRKKKAKVKKKLRG